MHTGRTPAYTAKSMTRPELAGGQPAPMWVAGFIRIGRISHGRTSDSQMSGYSLNVSAPAEHIEIAVSHISQRYRV